MNKHKTQTFIINDHFDIRIVKGGRERVYEGRRWDKLAFKIWKSTPIAANKCYLAER